MNIFIMALEPLETRYTGQWFDGFPMLLRDAAALAGRSDVQVHNVAGEQVECEVTEGAFLNFTATNIWKNTQINEMALKFSRGEIQAGDHVIFTDAWHTGIQQIKYMSELINIPVTIHSMWHAGSYDPQDFLGRLIKDKRWTHAVEKSFFYASDYNYFATMFHRNLFLEGIFPDDFSYNMVEDFTSRAVICGQPHNRLVAGLSPFRGIVKKRQILFPHRLAPEKQPEIFRDLATCMPDVTFVVAQDSKLTKDEYHRLLAESQIIFSANLQETLGISAMEGILVDAIPFLPNRLSYTEMYEENFLYPSEWTENWDAYLEHREEIIGVLRHMLNNPLRYKPAIEKQEARLLRDYLTCNPMVERLLK
jgi:glycosyltransferase involved in cell wall biosynthesis